MIQARDNSDKTGSLSHTFFDAAETKDDGTLILRDCLFESIKHQGNKEILMLQSTSIRKHTHTIFVQATPPPFMYMDSYNALVLINVN